MLDFPEALWWMHSSKKQGLIPRVETFISATTVNAATIVLGGVVNNESEYDLLMTHVALLVDTNVNGTKHGSIRINDPDFGSAVVPVFRMSAKDTGQFSLGGMLDRPLLLRPGATLSSEGVFLGADASNNMAFSGFGFYIPKLLI